MKPVIFFLIVLGILATIALIALVTAWWIRRSAGLNRVELHRVEHDRDLLLNAINDIYGKSLPYGDYENPLAMEVRTIVHRLQQKRLESRR